MNTVLWLIAGGVLAGAAFHYFNLNGERGLVIAIVIGVVGAYFGGSVLAPIIDGSGTQAGEFNVLALGVAGCTALGVVCLSDAISDRYGA